MEAWLAGLFGCRPEQPPSLSYTYTGIPAEYATADTGIGIATATRADGVVVTSVATINKTASAIGPAAAFYALHIQTRHHLLGYHRIPGDTTDLDDRYA
jgi:hypothetical protein